MLKYLMMKNLMMTIELLLELVRYSMDEMKLWSAVALLTVALLAVASLAVALLAVALLAVALSFDLVCFVWILCSDFGHLNRLSFLLDYLLKTDVVRSLSHYPHDRKFPIPSSKPCLRRM